MRVAAPLAVRADDRATLLSWTRSSQISAGLAQRARIVLLAGDGVPNAEIAERVGASRPTVRLWRSRYEAEGLDGLEDEPRSGRPAEIDPLDVVIATLAPPPSGWA